VVGTVSAISPACQRPVRRRYAAATSCGNTTGDFRKKIKESGTVPTCPTSSTASLTQAVEGTEPEDTVSDPAVLLTSCERAKVVVERGLLKLNQKLAVFTVVSMQELHLVKLFPRLSCSCPATATRYNMAAKMAVGMAVPDARTGTVNLTQLCCNKWKQADKISICHTCDSREPPARKCCHVIGMISWVGRESCPRWYYVFVWTSAQELPLMLIAPYPADCRQHDVQLVLTLYNVWPKVTF